MYVCVQLAVTSVGQQPASLAAAVAMLVADRAARVSIKHTQLRLLI
jgi:hypothetical protein